ncbi:MAG: hypothetical protein LUE29_05480 [Lachnospiraceae bacterium]|nr:hypothetical protein [Lachnospiraceae bacterium]
MRKRTKRLITLAAVLVLALVSTICVMASGNNAHFTFTNTLDAEPDLYVTKTVASSIEGYTAPTTDENGNDLEFTFVLKWDLDGDGVLEFASSEVYTVYAADGTEVVEYDAYGAQVVNRTSSTGRFTLKAGQTAKFDYVGTDVEYEVTEVNLDALNETISGSYTQTTPAGGTAASGTVAETGTIVYFENTYIPETEGETTELSIRKDVLSWPGGYEVPEYLGPFTFQVTLDGSVYARRTYTVYDTETGDEVDTGTTDASGCFAIYGGQTAVFKEVEVGIDYSVEEITANSGGWTSVGETTLTGATTAPIVYLEFTNASAYLIVEKDMADGLNSDDEEFSFTLTSNLGGAVAGAVYYLYDADGKLIADDGNGNEVSQPLTTGADGTFSLKAGQRAVFVGLTEGVTYTVKETVEEGYIAGVKVNGETGQTTAAAVKVNGTAVANGVTTDTELSASTTIGTYTDEQTIQFTNTRLGKIEITKKRSNSDKVLEGASFTLTDGDGTEVASGTTDENGSLIFENLVPGTYTLTETRTADGYLILEEPLTVSIPYIYENAGAVTDELIAEWKDAGIYDSCYLSDDEDAYYFYYVKYTITNEAGLEMPSTGESGLPWYYPAFGLIVILAGVTVWTAGKRRKGVIA